MRLIDSFSGLHLRTLVSLAGLSFAPYFLQWKMTSSVMAPQWYYSFAANTEMAHELCCFNESCSLRFCVPSAR